MNECADVTYHSTGRCSYLQQILFKVLLKPIEEEVGQWNHSFYRTERELAVSTSRFISDLLYDKTCRLWDSGVKAESFPIGMTAGVSHLKEYITSGYMVETIKEHS